MINKKFQSIGEKSGYDRPLEIGSVEDLTLSFDLVRGPDKDRGFIQNYLNEHGFTGLEVYRDFRASSVFGLMSFKDYLGIVKVENQDVFPNISNPLFETNKKI